MAESWFTPHEPGAVMTRVGLEMRRRPDELGGVLVTHHKGTLWLVREPPKGKRDETKRESETSRAT